VHDRVHVAAHRDLVTDSRRSCVDHLFAAHGLIPQLAGPGVDEAGVARGSGRPDRGMSARSRLVVRPLSNGQSRASGAGSRAGDPSTAADYMERERGRAPLRLQRIADRGACGKTQMVPAHCSTHKPSWHSGADTTQPPKHFGSPSRNCSSTSSHCAASAPSSPAPTSATRYPATTTTP